MDVFKDRIGTELIEYSRVTFYEDYSYSQFVGCYMPVPNEDSQQEIQATFGAQRFEGSIIGEHITYRFSPGPFAKILAKAFLAKLKNEDKKYILIIEELNRANAASVFGDIFQLLDREKGISIYETSISEAFSCYLYDSIMEDLNKSTTGTVIGFSKADLRNIKLPDNLYIWATMNSADQGVFPLDAAFKRRWTPYYRDIRHDDPANMLRPLICLPYIGNDGALTVGDFDWNEFRNGINQIILDSGFEEDRCVGYWFFSEEEMAAIKRYSESAVNAFGGDQASKEALRDMAFPLVDKLFSYLRQDVFRLLTAHLSL